jgi:hypothetical protein
LFYVNKNFSVVSVLLTMEKFPPPHTAAATANVVKETLKKWGLDKLVDMGVSDNASVMVAAFEELAMRRLPCAAHWLQLSLSDCLFGDGPRVNRQLQQVIAKCRAIVGHFSRSPEALEELLELQRKRKWSPVRPVQDNETRWNSTYALLKSLVALKEVLTDYANARQSDLKGEHWEAVFDARFWMLIEEMLSVLEPWAAATDKLQGDADKQANLSGGVSADPAAQGQVGIGEASAGGGYEGGG